MGTIFVRIVVREILSAKTDVWIKCAANNAAAIGDNKSESYFIKQLTDDIIYFTWKFVYLCNQKKENSGDASFFISNHGNADSFGRICV